MSSSSGISWRHGPHQVAQKLIITTWPLNWERSMALPLRPVSWNAGAGPDDEVANTGNANTRASARPLAIRPIPLVPIPLAFTMRADMMLTPSEKDGRAEQGLEVVGDLGLA